MKKQILLLTGLLYTQSSAAIAADVATFGKSSISVKDYKQAVEDLGERGEMIKNNKQVRSQFLNHLIDNTLLSSEAKKSKLQDSKQFQKLLESAKKEILARMYVDKFISENTSPSKLKSYFESHKKKFSDKEVRASHILIKEADKALAEKVLKEAKGGADFAKLAEKHSTGPSKSRGGDLSFFGPGRMVPSFEKAAFGTAKGKVHPELVKTQFGWHIIKVTDVRGGDNVKFEDKKDEVLQTIKRNSRRELLEKLRKQANVKVNDKVLDEMKL